MDIPVPATSVNVSAALSAETLSCPDTAIVANDRLEPPPPPPPPEITISQVVPFHCHVTPPLVYWSPTKGLFGNANAIIFVPLLYLCDT